MNEPGYVTFIYIFNIKLFFSWFCRVAGVPGENGEKGDAGRSGKMGPSGEPGKKPAARLLGL